MITGPVSFLDIKAPKSAWALAHSQFGELHVSTNKKVSQKRWPEHAESVPSVMPTPEIDKKHHISELLQEETDKSKRVEVLLVCLHVTLREKERCVAGRPPLTRGRPHKARGTDDERRKDGTSRAVRRKCKPQV